VGSLRLHGPLTWPTPAFNHAAATWVHVVGRRRWHRGTREILSPANTASAPLPKAAAAAAAAVDADAIRHCQPTPGDYRTGN